MNDDLQQLGQYYSPPHEPTPPPTPPVPTDADIARLRRAFAEPAPARKAAKFTPSPLAVAVREMFRREKAERERLAAQIEDLLSQVTELRAEIAVERRLREVCERVDRLEASRSTLRAVAG